MSLVTDPYAEILNKSFYSHPPKEKIAQEIGAKIVCVNRLRCC